MSYKLEQYWGNIDPFLIGAVVILLSTWYALPKYLGESLEMQVAFYATAAFVLLFDAYARGLFELPKSLFRGPLASVLIILNGVVMFVVLFLSIPYLITGVLEDLLGMFGFVLNQSEVSWVILALSLVGVLLFTSFLNRTIQGHMQGSAFKAEMPAPARPPAAATKTAKSKKRRR